MTRKRAALWCGAGLAALLGVCASAVALTLYRPQLVRPWVERALTPRGGTASLSGLRVSLAPPALTLSGLAIAGPPQEGDILRLSHLRFELIPRSFLHGGPWFRHVEATGLVFDRPKPRETKDPLDLEPLTRLFDIEDLSLADARLRMAMPQGDLAVDGVRLSLIPGENGVRAFNGYGELTFRRNGSVIAEGKISAKGTVTPDPAIEGDLELASARLKLPWIAGDVIGRSKVRVTRRILLAEGLDLALANTRLSLDPRAQENLGPVRLNATAGARLDGKDTRLEVRGLDIGGLLLARGSLRGPTVETLSGTLEGEIPKVERARKVLDPLLPASYQGMGLTGSLPYRLTLSARGAERVLAVEVTPRDLLYSWPTGGLGCRFGGSLRAESTFTGWRNGKARMAGRLQGTGHFERPPLTVRSFRFDAPLAGEIAAPALPGWKLSAGTGDLLYEGRPLPLGILDARGSGRPIDNSWRVEGVEIRSESLGRLTGEVDFRGGTASGRLYGVGIPLDKMAPLATALGGPDMKGWSPAGSIDIAARLEPTEGGPRVTATATSRQVGFTSPSGDVMGQNLAGRIVLEAILAPKPRMNVDLALLQGEALLGKVYLDLAKDPLELHAEGTHADVGDYKDLVLEGGSEGFGRLKIEGKARKAGGTWRHEGRLALRDARLGAIFRTFLRDPLAAAQPDLAGLEMNGTGGIDLSFSGTGKLIDLNGRLRVRSGDVRREKETPLLSGLDIDLPIAYSLGVANPGRPRPADSARWGRLSLKKLRVSGQELGPLEFPIIVVPNNLYLGGTVATSLFGAKVSLRRIQADEPLSPDFRIRMAAQLDNLDLARLSGKEPLLEGHAGGLLDPVTIGRERMTADGTLTGDLFGGRMEVRHVTVDRPFSPGREIGADVNVRLTDLERLSAALGVGRITGRLSGSVEGLRIAYGQPVAFHLKMESVETKGVSQSVSLKAVNSISLVSTGSALSGLGVSLMATFFREFPYEKIGFECGLKNDVFTVRGLIHEDGVEYLVKRRFFGGINVINRNPDNRIGFSDMQERAKRVTGERSN